MAHSNHFNSEALGAVIADGDALTLSIRLFMIYTPVTNTVIEVPKQTV